MTRTNSDLDRANEHAAQRQRAKQAYRRRTTARRNKRRQVDLVSMLVRTGAVR